MLVAPPTADAAPTLASLLRAFQAQANEVLAQVGYLGLNAQVSASILPESGLHFTVSAADPTTVLHDTLSFGMGSTPAAALREFGERLQVASLVREAA